MTRHWSGVFVVWIWAMGGFAITTILLTWAKVVSKYWQKEMNREEKRR